MRTDFEMKYGSKLNAETRRHSVISNWNVFLGSVLSLIAAFYGENSISLIASIVFVIYAITRPLSERAEFVVMGLTNTKGLALAGASCSVVICFISVVLILISKKRINRKLLLWGILYVFYSLQYCFRDAGMSYGIVFPVKMISVLTFYYFLSENEVVIKNPIEFLYASVYCYLAGTIGAAIGSFAMYSRFAIYGNDSNALGLQMAFLLAMFCVLYFRYNKISTINFSLLFIVTSAIGMGTGSRTFLILLACVVFVSVILNVNRFGKSIWVIVVITFAVLVFLTSNFGKSTIDTLITRQNVMAARGDISNGRIDLWKEYIRYFNQNKLFWLFGVGTYSVTGIGHVAHNMILEGITAYGLLGIALLFRIYALIITNFKANLCQKKMKRDIYIYFPLSIPLIGNFVLHDLTNIYNTTMIFLGVISVFGYNSCMLNKRKGVRE